MMSFKKYLFGCTGLSCDTQGSSSDQRLSPGTLHRELGVIAARQSGSPKNTEFE